MKNTLKVLSIALAFTASISLPQAHAESSTSMLISLAETKPALVEQLNNLALTDAKLLAQLLTLSESKPEQLQRLLDLKAQDPTAFEHLVTIKQAEAKQKQGEVGENGTISDGGVIRT
ncbi:hypothetical protein [Litorilituus sediminis]|uniref:Uncharacterized protein n=1 Tax=Litorilituus sediminis TaxID=718192 RepID=A0A4P6P5X4_9GAMM|nr:hypothetical protein [Litorilituus sediminis]QBG36864.1 hypothetical protein EMK97_14605 [Litorilituus sediminis]